VDLRSVPELGSSFVGLGWHPAFYCCEPLFAWSSLLPVFKDPLVDRKRLTPISPLGDGQRGRVFEPCPDFFLRLFSGLPPFPFGPWNDGNSRHYSGPLGFGAAIRVSSSNSRGFWVVLCIVREMSVKTFSLPFRLARSWIASLFLFLFCCTAGRSLGSFPFFSQRNLQFHPPPLRILNLSLFSTPFPLFVWLVWEGRPRPALSALLFQPRSVYCVPSCPVTFFVTLVKERGCYSPCVMSFLFLDIPYFFPLWIPPALVCAPSH